MKRNNFVNQSELKCCSLKVLKSKNSWLNIFRNGNVLAWHECGNEFLTSPHRIQSQASSVIGPTVKARDPRAGSKSSDSIGLLGGLWIPVKSGYVEWGTDEPKCRTESNSCGYFTTSATAQNWATDYCSKPEAFSCQIRAGSMIHAIPKPRDQRTDILSVDENPIGNGSMIPGKANKRSSLSGTYGWNIW